MGNTLHWSVCSAIDVITNPHFRRVFVSLSYLVHFCGTNGIPIYQGAKFPIFLQELRKYFFSHFSFYWEIIQVVSNCSLLSYSFWFPFTVCISGSKCIAHYFVFCFPICARLYHPNNDGELWENYGKCAVFKSARRAGFEIQRLSGVTLWCWCSSCTETFARVRVITDKEGRPVQRKNGIAQQLNTRMFFECNDVLLH